MVQIRREVIITLVQTLGHRVQVQILVRLVLVVARQRVQIHGQNINDRYLL